MKRILALALSFNLAACTSSTMMSSTNKPLNVKINENASVVVDKNYKNTYATTSFGQYKFKATKKGSDPMYGLIPLKFNGGYLALDILFFAPAMLFNLRSVYPFYEFDFDKGVIKYKKKENDEWMEYKPTQPEVEHAKTYFGEL